MALKENTSNFLVIQVIKDIDDNPPSLDSPIRLLESVTPSIDFNEVIMYHQNFDLKTYGKLIVVRKTITTNNPIYVIMKTNNAIFDLLILQDTNTQISP